MSPWESRCLWLPWSSPSHCQPPWEPCGQGIMAISVTTSQLRLCQGPSPHQGGAQGWWMGQSWGWGCTWALAGQGPCAAAAQGQCLPAAGHAQSSRTTGGCQGISVPWPRRSQKSPHTPPWCWVNSQPRTHSAPCGSRIPVTLSSYSHREPLENIRWQRRDVPGPALEALGALLERQGAERCAVTSTTSRPRC